ncbi:Sn1-specific diacylglycerol lipase [Seminavis robusta]|uniref:sn-1-specific diacylglycerol lipase n=1 Tax=Seminavis robusta TaxID=568900 RepID=A0A9N8HE86_9STRA|nr:Sn1-specific diacylglycerol lipase [Seminavis robusta]|eukprot:Sro503_g155700.1 Sn1-specific diacylglycerol lipase (616) ;mRNA; f:503-2350
MEAGAATNDVVGGGEDRAKDNENRMDSTCCQQPESSALQVKLPNRPPGKNVSPMGKSLTQARRIIWRGDPPMILKPVLLPLRIFLLDPIFNILSRLVPLFLPARIDKILTTILLDYLTIPVLRTLYVHHTPVMNKGGVFNEQLARNATRNVILQPTVVAIHPPTDIQSAFQGVVSFICSAIGDIAGIVTNPRKLTGWMTALRQFNTFLEQTGVGAELEEAIQKPLLQGRLLDNVKILSDIQKSDNDNHDRVLKAQKEDDYATMTVAMHKDIQRGHRLMRFATSAYGTDMIRSALDIQVDAHQLIEIQENPLQAISIHTQIPTGDVKFLYAGNDTDYDKHVLHHFVAIDHKHQSIVLAIRGTLSLSGAIVDIQGMATDYCSGKAHKGMSEMARNLWNDSGFKIAALMTTHEDYKLVVTGHSLGAGTACLLTLLLYVEEVFPNRTVECFAFAPPPTFFWDNHQKSVLDKSNSACAKQIEKAMQNTVAFIHDNDVVPFLSVSAVRRMINLLDSVDCHTESIWFWKRWRIFNDYDKVPSEITNSVLNVAERGAVDGEYNMCIPARNVVWCKQNILGRFEAFCCDPQKVAQGNIFLSVDMLTDHLPEQYENALDALLLST